MELREYKYFVAIVNNGSISRAAEKLYISQPSLSIFLKELEKKVGTTLIEKMKGGLVPTYEGNLLYNYACRILAMDEECQNTLHTAKEQQRGIIRIGVAPSRSSYLTPLLHSLITEAFPNVKIEIIEIRNELLVNQVRNMEIDFALLSCRSDPKGLQQIGIYDEEVVLIAAEGDPIGKNAIQKEGFRYPWLSIPDIASRPLILLEKGRSLRNAAESLFLQDGCSANIAYETQSMFTCLQLVKQGQFLSFIYDSSAYMNLDKGVCIYSVGNTPIKTRFGLLINPSATINPLKKEITSYVHKALLQAFISQ